MNSADTSGSYSPFWPVFLVFVTLVVLQLIYVAGDFKDRAQIQKASAEIAPLVIQAQKITQTVENLGKDLIDLANGENVEARRIVTDLNIQVRQAPAAAQQ